MILRVLVVEDDDGVADAVVTALAAHEHSVLRVARAADVWTRVQDADLVLLDLGLPDADGLDVLRKLRRIADTAVLVLTARGTERDVVRGLRLGADDYLIKPVRVHELLARIEAVGRRLPSVAPITSGVTKIEDLLVDLDARRVTLGTDEITLTSKEFDILAVLARRPGAAVSRQQLMDEVWGDAYLAVSRALDVHLVALRGKLGRPGLLHTIRGFGYRLGR